MDSALTTHPGIFLPHCGFSLSINEMFVGVGQKLTGAGSIAEKFLTGILTQPKEIYSLVGRFTSGVVRVLGEIIQGDKAKFNEFSNAVQPEDMLKNLVSRPRGPPKFWASIAEAFKKG
jgi:hypothetical protein